MDSNSSEKSTNNVGPDDFAIKQQEDPADFLRSSHILLDLVKSEYACEDERAKNLDNRTGILISSIVVLLTFYLPTINFQPYLIKTQYNLSEAILLVTLLVMHLSTVGSIGTSLIYFCSSISVRNYSRLEATDFLNHTMASIRDDIVAYSYVITITKCLEKNREANNAKMERYKKGLNFLIITAVLMITSTLMSKLFT